MDLASQDTQRLEDEGRGSDTYQNLVGSQKVLKTINQLQAVPEEKEKRRSRHLRTKSAHQPKY